MAPRDHPAGRWRRASWLHLAKGQRPSYTFEDNNRQEQGRKLRPPRGTGWDAGPQSSPQNESALPGCCQFLKRKELMLGRKRAKADGFKRSFPGVRPFNSITSSSLSCEYESGKENSLYHKLPPDICYFPQFSQTPGTQGQGFHFYRQRNGGSGRFRKPPRVTQPPKSNSGK